jgi:hypothetical protein
MRGPAVLAAARREALVWAAARQCEMLTALITADTPAGRSGRLAQARQTG